MARYTIELSDEAKARLGRLLAAGNVSPSTVMEAALESLEADLTHDKQVQDFRAMSEEAFADAAGSDAIVLNSEEELKTYMDGILNEVLAKKGAHAEAAA